MEKRETVTRVLHNPVITARKNSPLHVTDDINSLFKVNIKQLEETTTGEKVKKAWRHGLISGDMEPMLEMEFYDGMLLPGKIKVTESFLPIVEDDPEQYIKRNRNGSICRVDGKVVYRTEAYTSDHREEDTIIDC
jgi:hypothetical protein